MKVIVQNITAKEAILNIRKNLCCFLSSPRWVLRRTAQLDVLPWTDDRLPHHLAERNSFASFSAPDNRAPKRWSPMNPSEQNLTLQLPAKLGQSAAEALRALLIEASGRDLVLDASAVEHLGGQCAQVLIACRRAWHEDILTFTIADPSPKLVECADLLGLRDHLFDAGAEF